MRRVVIAAAAALLLAGPVVGSQAQAGGARPARQGGQGGRPGQGPGGFGRGGILLLTIPEVQKELVITEAQLTKLAEKYEDYQAKTREMFQGLQQASPEERQAAMGKVQALSDGIVKEVLNETQAKRFRELELQQLGPRGLIRKDVAEKMKVTTEQNKKIADIIKEEGDSTRKMFEDIGGFQAIRDMSEADRAKFQEKQANARKATDEKIVGVLTDAQKKQWAEMTGKPFKFPEMQRRPRPM